MQKYSVQSSQTVAKMSTFIDNLLALNSLHNKRVY